MSHWFSGQSDCLQGCWPGFESLEHYRVLCNFFSCMDIQKIFKKMAHPYDIIYCDIILRYHMSCALEHKLQTYDIIYMISYVISYMISYYLISYMIWYHIEWDHTMLSYMISYVPVSLMISHMISHENIIVWYHSWYCHGDINHNMWYHNV